MNHNMLLSTNGSRITNRVGNSVVLRGFGLGGWMNMENFITGYPANEEAQREAVRAVLGAERYELFFDRFLEHFFTEDDARFIRSLGLNLLRLPVNYRHLEDDMRPFEIKEGGFKHLDKTNNILCLCPNHHVLFDHGGIVIDKDLSLVGAEGTLKVSPRHSLNEETISNTAESII